MPKNQENAKLLKNDKIIGYTAGVFDLFHLGHVIHLRNAKAMCDYLIVGVSSDDLIKNIKQKKNIMDYYHRSEVVKSCRYVDLVVPQDDFDRVNVWEKLKFDITFIGDDWINNEKWKEIASKLEKKGVRVVYFPYTKGVSSTTLKEILNFNGVDKN